MGTRIVFVELDDLYNRHVALHLDRIVAITSIGDAGTEVHMDNGTSVQVKHTTADVLGRMRHAVELAHKAAAGEFR